MNLSKAKIALFFLAVAVLGALLYPRALFLAFMYEGTADLTRAENHYLDYLSRHPNDKFASLRLAELYNRMAEPEKAVPVLESLYDHRKKDWKVAKAWLEQLEEMHEDDGLFRARLKIAGDFRNSTRRQEAVYLFEAALGYALWKQDYPAAYAILNDLQGLESDASAYSDTREMLNRSLKKWDAVLAGLREKIERDPKDLESRRDVVNVYVAKGDLARARREADAVLEFAPDDSLALQARVFIATRLKDHQTAIADIKRILNLGGLTERQRLLYRGDLASLYQETGDWKRALSIFRDLLRLYPENQVYWDGVLAIFVEKKDWKGATSFLKSYLKSFPQDFEKKKQLVDIYLYEWKDPNALALYADFLESTRDVRFGLDVAFLLIEQKWTTRAEEWLRRCVALFPGDLRVEEALIGSYLERKNYAAAALLLEKSLNVRPGDVKALSLLAQVRSLQGDGPAAAVLYERLAELKPDFETLFLAGKELLFMGLGTKAKPLLERASALNPASAEAHYWLAEALGGGGGGKSALSEYASAAALFENLSKRTEEEERMRLKSRARLGFSNAVRADYRAALAKYPQNADLRADELDLLLEARDAGAAERALSSFRTAFPKETERALTFHARLAFLRRDWKSATSALRELIAAHPFEWGYRRDLAEAEALAGHWKTALREYETVQAGAGERFNLRRTIDEMRDEYATKASADFRFVKLGSESFVENRASFGGWLGEKFKFDAAASFGRFFSGLLDREDDAVSGGASVSYRHSPSLTVKGGLGFGASAARETVTPSLGALWIPDPRLSFSAEGRYRGLRADLPQAVARGTLTDDFNWIAQWAPVSRLFLSARYRFERNVLPRGETSYGHLFEPSAAWAVLRDPYLSVGYQFSLADNSDGNGFLNLVGLVPRVEAHYLTAFAAKDLADGAWHVEGNAFWGEDPARGLRLFEADLFGAGVRADWRASRFLKLRAGYDFGRETLTNTSGSSHQVNVGITGHW